MALLPLQAELLAGLGDIADTVCKIPGLPAKVYGTSGRTGTNSPPRC